MLRTLISFAFECLPMVFYYGVSFYTDFRSATTLYVLSTLIVVVVMFLLQKRLPYLSLLFGFFVITAGLATIFTDNPDIIILSDSVYFFLGTILLCISLKTKHTLLEKLFGSSFALQPTGWRVLTKLWIGVFLSAGITNELVRIYMTPEWWIGFQFWRGCVIIGFSILFLFVCRRYRLPTASSWGIRLPAKRVGQ